MSVTWFIDLGPGGLRVNIFGHPFDAAYLADLNGDNRDDIVMARNDAMFQAPIIHHALLSGTTYVPIPFGSTGEDNILDKVDSDGDGTSDITVYRASVTPGVKYTRQSSNGMIRGFAFGDPNTDFVWGGDDFDGDNRDDLVAMRGFTGPCCDWWIMRKDTGTPFQPYGSGYRFGGPGDLPASGNFFGDIRAELGVYRDPPGILYAFDTSMGGLWAVQWGAPGDFKPFVR
jgi:hypothetical protein